MYVFLTVSLCDCVHGKGQHQLGQGERSFKEVPFSQPRKQTWLATHHWLSCSQTCSRALRLVWEIMKRYPRINLGPFANGPSGNQTGDPHFTSRWNHQILSQDQLQAVDLLLWLGARRHWCRCRKYYICPAPTSELSSKARLPYACITGYATTPPIQRVFHELLLFTSPWLLANALKKNQ